MTYRSTLLARGDIKWYFELDETSGTNAVDDAGAGADGTYNGGFTLNQTPGPIADESGGWVLLNGTTGFVTAADHADRDLADLLSVIVWFKRTATGGSEQILLDKGNNTYAVSVNCGGVADTIGVVKSGVSVIVKSTTNVADTNVHMFAWTKTGSTNKIYLDGVDVTGSVTNATLADSAGPLVLGRLSNSSTLFFGGRLGRISGHNAVISAADIATLYALATGTQVTPGIITSTAVIYAPVITSASVQPALISQTAAIYAPTVGLSFTDFDNYYPEELETTVETVGADETAAWTEDSSVDTGAPAAQSVTPALIDRTAIINAPDVQVAPETVEPALLSYTALIYSPSIAPPVLGVHLEVATDANATTWADHISRVPLYERAQFGGHGFRAEVGTGSGFDIDDDAGSVSVPSRRVCRLVIGTTTLFRGRVSTKGLARGTPPTGAAKEFDVQLDDYNMDLYGIVVDQWVRPAETDYQRVVALRNEFLAGSPRASTNLALTYVKNANLRNLPEKTYEATHPAGVLADIINFSGKNAFVTVDGELFYDLLSSVDYAAGLSITDVTPNGTTSFGPIQPTATVEADELVSGVYLIRTDGTRSVGQRGAVSTAHDRWETSVYDSDVTVSDATPLTDSLLDDIAQEEKSYRASIRLTESQLGLVKWGQTLSFRSAAVGLTTPVTVRVMRLIWQAQIDGDWIADMELGYPTKLDSRIGGGLVQGNTRFPASVLVPGSLSITPFADTIRPIAIVASLPTLPDTAYPENSRVALSTDGKLYANVGGVWSRAVDGVDLVADSVTAAAIAAGAISASEIAAGAVSADKLSVGSRGQGNLVSNGSFEDAGAGSTVAGWTHVINGGALTSQREVLANSKDGEAVLTLHSTAGAGNNSYAFSPNFPVGAGEALFGSVFYRSTATITGGIYFRLNFYDYLGAFVSYADFFTDRGVTGAATWTEFNGYVTVPASAAYANVQFFNYQPSAATYLNFDKCRIERMAGGVRNSTAYVLIDEAGITVTNGALTLTNAGSTLIIDGTSNMFKIAASGTLTRAFPATGNGVETGVVLSGLGSSYTAVPQLLALNTNDNSLVTTRRNLGVSVSLNFGTGVVQYMSEVFSDLNASPGSVGVSLRAVSCTVNPATTAGCRYYVLVEAGV